MEFVHLHVNTEYSLLRSSAKIEALVARAKELQFSEIAITDQSVLYGVIPFYKACKQVGIKPIIGLELCITTKNKDETWIILLAKSQVGYQNLMKLSSISQVLGSNQKKQVEKHHLFSYCKDLIAISSPSKGEIQQLVLEGKSELALLTIKEYQTHFGDDFYIGIHDHGMATEKELNLKIVKLSREYQMNLVVTNQVVYIRKEDALAQRCLLAIEQGTTLEEIKTEFHTNEYYLKSKQEMEQLFSQIPEALLNTKKIADKCNLILNFGEHALPKFPLPAGVNSKEYLFKLCQEGLLTRYKLLTDEIQERLLFELKIIDQMQFNDYFLIVWDFMKFAHEKGMITGPGRGSAAGSLVAYVLHITNVDPIKYDLLFERFLNPERITMPDIDIDFPDTRREEVIEYVFQKYGKNHVAQIITFGTLAAKAALRDIGKVLGIPLKQIDSVAKQISSRPNLTIDEAVKETPSLQKLIQESDVITDWFHLAKRVEGIPRHASTHAAGIVISKDPLTDKVPVQKGHYEVLLTQYPMTILEEIGLLKMDFLGLRNLSFLEEIVSHIYQMEGKKINLESIPFDDQNTFQLLGVGDTTGVFQLESPGMRRVLSNLKPTEFEDIVAVNALYRPGPMENIPLFIAGKHNKRQVNYTHPDLKPILEKTYGVIIYQEQIMQIASKLAGFSLGEADILRRAVSKKKLETLEEQRNRFVQGCLKRGYDQKISNDVYDLIVRFANYGFNRSHSVAYSVISYQLAYLKANYPSAFFTALLTSAIGQPEKINQYIIDAKKKGIIVLTPSINKCSAGFIIGSSNDIEFGLAAIKNVGIRAIEEIVRERQKGGYYKNIFNFCARVSTRYINRRTLESLVAAGSFDDFGQHRASLLATLDYALEFGEQVRQQTEDRQSQLFYEEVKVPEGIQVPPFKDSEKLHYEKEALGFYLSSHPIEDYSEVANSHNRILVADALAKGEGIVRLAGLLETIRVVKTKKGEQMAFLKFSDESGELELTVFPKQYREFFALMKIGQLVFLEGKLEVSNERTQVIISKVLDVKNLSRSQIKEGILYLKIDQNHANQTKLVQLKSTLKMFPGNSKVILYYEERKQTVQLSDEFRITASNQCIEALNEMLGKGNVVLKS
ncbi:DNA polymerase III subunit alpha [Anaerobacillus alkaliphilus]|uniref:DNA polymerase III subunit alpha n=1 Tax=Anaerobacillus alkaliphilus TaxID=1548597 RepID=A0A4V1LG50_9BACI|nr:DNA polymerase III subunit alpha [Anaerobacillus alkaliphilus]RXI98534.1 DNA polymerase III subunit alpha [Anaerobacillus alkaliphilus]